jgi:hypothetical protein
MIGVSVSGGIRHRTASETLHTADDVLVGSKVCYLSNFSAAPHSGERPQSAQGGHSPASTIASPGALHTCRSYLYYSG